MTVRITHFSGTPDRNQYEARLPMLGDATWRRPSESGTQRRLAALQKFGCDRSKEDIRGRRKRLDLSKMTSRPEEFHLRALPEPCMTLSSHTAPDVRPLLERLCLVHRLLLFPVGQWPRPNNAAPSLQPHYRAFDATTGCSAPGAPLRYSRPRGWSRLRL